jgi:hypothetical protein
MLLLLLGKHPFRQGIGFPLEETENDGVEANCSQNHGCYGSEKRGTSSIVFPATLFSFSLLFQ